MFSFGKKPAPAPAANGLTQNQANAALVKALHNVANVKLRNAINKAKAAANATGAEKNKKIAELQAAINAAGPVVKAANAAAPNKPVETATQNAEVSAVNSILRNIAKYNTRENLNKVKNNQRYKNATNDNKARINSAVNNRRLELITPIV